MTTEEMAAKLEALEKNAEEQSKRIAAQDEEMKALKAAATTAKAETSSEEKPARKLVVPTGTVTIDKKKYQFVVAKFRLKMDSSFETFIAEDEMKNKALLEHLVENKRTAILKPA